MESETNNKVQSEPINRLQMVKTLLTDLNDKYPGAVNDEVFANTPKRFIKAFDEMTKGYKVDVTDLLETGLFEVEQPIEDLVVVDKIPFNSMCEHHLLSFSGSCSIAYVPDQKLLGLSKFARLVEAFSSRISSQERITYQVAEAIFRCVKPKGVIVYLESIHTCMSIRGIKSTGSLTKTIHCFGNIKEDQKLKDQFFNLIK